MKNRLIIGVVVFVVSFLGIQISCNNNNQQSKNFPALEMPTNDPGGNTGNAVTIAGSNMQEVKPQAFNIVVQEGTQKIGTNLMQKLQNFDEASNTYHFASNANEIDSLKPGTVTFFEGHSIKRIVSVTNTGNGIDVVTQDALFTEYFKDADIKWNAQINWGEKTTPASTFKITMGNYALAQQPTEKNLEQQLNELNEEKENDKKEDEQKKEIEENGIDVKKGLGMAIPSFDAKEKKFAFEGSIKGWQISVKLQPQGETIGIELTASKGKFINLKAKGLVSHFNNESSIQVKDGKLEQFDMMNKGVNANMQLMFDAEALGEEENVFRLPIGISQMFIVAGIPVAVNVKCIFNIAPVLGEKAKTASSCFLNYNSNTGFKYSNGVTEFSNSSLPKCEIDDGEKKPGAEALGTDQIGVGLGLEFPRFEVGILGKLVVPYAVHKTTLKTFFDPGYFMGNKKDKCFQSSAEMKGSIGVMLNFFGLASYNVNKDVYIKKKELVRKGKCDGDL
jgi:hypothetical protein